MQKVCRLCLKEKNLNDFYKNKNACKFCLLTISRTKEEKLKRNKRLQANYSRMTYLQKQEYFNKHKIWAENNKEKVKANHLKHAYGISLEFYNKMLSKQNNLCAICNSPPKGKRPLAVDHCHKTGKVRGLLCYRCNRALSIVEDKPWLSKAAVYINQ